MSTDPALDTASVHALMPLDAGRAIARTTQSQAVPGPPTDSTRAGDPGE